MCWLILGGRSNGLAVARALGCPSNVYVLDCSPDKPVSVFSQYVKEVFIIGSEFQCVASFLDDFLSIKEAVLIATDDWWLYQVSKYKEFSDKKFYGFFPDRLMLDLILDKKALYEFFSDCVVVPKIVDPADAIDLEGYIVKPRISFNEAGIIEKGINSFDKYKGLGVDVVVQENIDAPLDAHLSICGIRVGGRILYPFFSRKIMEYPSPMGTATMVQNINDPFLMEKLLECGQVILSRLDYKGIFELEFIVSQGQLWFIDFNPRFWLQHGMAINVGINYARLYSELSKDIVPISSLMEKSKVSKKLVWLHEGAPLSFIKSNNKLGILWMLITSKITFAHFKITDMKPFWYFLICKLRR